MRIKHLLFALLISICACATENGAPEQNTMPQMWQGVSKSLVKRIITEWCNYYYDDCFSGRKFDSISSVNFDSDDCSDVLYVTGKHNYYGRSFFGHRDHHTNVDFKAWIKVSANGDVRVRFWKYYEPDAPGLDGKWEKSDEYKIVNLD